MMNPKAMQYCTFAEPNKDLFCKTMLEETFSSAFLFLQGLCHFR